MNPAEIGDEAGSARRGTGLLGAAGTVAVLLDLAAGSPAQVMRQLHATITAQGAPAAAGASVVAAAALVAWCLLGYLAVGLALVTLSRLPGPAGRFAAAGARRVLPAVLRQALNGSLSVALLAGGPFAVLATPGAAAAAGSPAPSATAGTTTRAAEVPSLDWPGLPTASPQPAAGEKPPGRTPGAGSPAGPPAPSAVPRPSAAAADTDRASVGRSAAVVVNPGDSLWLLARRHLGGVPSDAAIACEWPRWYAANRAVIGDNPDLIYPGQQLTPPAEEAAS